MAVESDTARLFFAAWPSPEIQRALGGLGQTLQRQCGGKALPARNIHLTLIFLGDVPRERLPQLEAAAAAVEGPRFELCVGRAEYWRHNRIVWAGVERCPDALRALVNRLGQGLSSAGFRFDKRAYLPHVTLLRNARRAPLLAEMPAVAWPIASFALAESVQREKGRAYEVLREWPLST